MSFEFYTEPRLTMQAFTSRGLPEGFVRRDPQPRPRYVSQRPDGSLQLVEQYVLVAPTGAQIWAFVEMREPDAHYPRHRPGTVVFESFGEHDVEEILAAVAATFDVFVLDELGEVVAHP
jgi:hypothetical protein